ncbi:MAG: hypothetical protein ABEJ65_05170, partial [bacterium]
NHVYSAWRMGHGVNNKKQTNEPRSPVDQTLQSAPVRATGLRSVVFESVRALHFWNGNGFECSALLEHGARSMGHSVKNFSHRTA